GTYPGDDAPPELSLQPLPRDIHDKCMQYQNIEIPVPDTGRKEPRFSENQKRYCLPDPAAAFSYIQTQVPTVSNPLFVSLLSGLFILHFIIRLLQSVKMILVFN